MTAEVSTDALARWLLPRLDHATTVAVEDFSPPRSGYSAETTVFAARVGRGAEERVERFVLRRETPDPPVYPQQTGPTDTAIELQYLVMEAVSGASAVPVAPLIAYEPDPDVLGAPFFVMGHVDGEVPVENPIYTSEGFFVEATPSERRCLVLDGVRTLAAIHALDWRAAGLGWLVPDGAVPGTDWLLTLWEQYARTELGDRDHPLLDEAFAWLHVNLPASSSPLVLSWGDPRPGNIIWHDFRCACVTDWEAVSVAPPEYDLGWWLMFDRWSHETLGQPRLEGEPTRAEQVEHYAACAGRDVGDMHFFEVFAAARYAAIVVRVMNRYVARGDLPADHTIWLENPAATCLEELLHGGS